MRHVERKVACKRGARSAGACPWGDGEGRRGVPRPGPSVRGPGGVDGEEVALRGDRGVFFAGVRIEWGEEGSRAWYGE